jgi:hypothetical protein
MRLPFGSIGQIDLVAHKLLLLVALVGHLLALAARIRLKSLIRQHWLNDGEIDAQAALLSIGTHSNISKRTVLQYRLQAL